MTGSNDHSNGSLNKLLRDEGQFDPDKASRQKVAALKALRLRTIRVERLTWAFMGVCAMVFAFAWGLFHTSTDVKAMIFCVILMLWALATQILFVLIYATRNAEATILKEIKLQRLEQAGAASEAQAVDYWGRDLSLGTSRAERWVWWIAIVALAVIAGIMGTFTTVMW